MYIFILVVLFKIILMTVFSSGYQDTLFIPFVSHFVTNFDNPWEYYYSLQSYDIFPYPPAMLYILSAFYGVYNFLPFESILLQNFFFKLPVILSDLLIAYLLLRLFPKNHQKVLIYYFVSPIVFYAAFMHSQLDLIPTALLFASIFLMIKNKLLPSALIYGLAIGTKHHVLIALPLMVIYLYRNRGLKDILKFVLTFAAVFTLISLPFLNSYKFYSMIFSNPKQSLLFDSFFMIGDLKLYLPVFVAYVLFLRFFIYSKVNNDLFFAYLNLIFAIFILVVKPAPGWYLWIVPFMSIFFIRFHHKFRYGFILYCVLTFTYLSYFILFFIPDYPDLLFIGKQINLKIGNINAQNLSFTILEVVLLGFIYSFYKMGVRSNQVYRQDQAFVIGISGDSGSGKTTLLGELKQLIGENLVQIEGDADHKWERGDAQWKQMTHLDPKANFLHRQAENILALKSGQNVLRVNYDHNTGTFTRKKMIKSSDFVIISGLHTLYLPMMRKALDLKISLDPGNRIRKHWKILRDMNERGYACEKILEQIEKRAPDSKKFIQPQKGFADLIIRYFPKEDFEIGNIASSPSLGLEMTIDSNINLEPLLFHLSKYGINYSFDYSEDLKTQFLQLQHPPEVEFIKSCSSEIIENIDEIVSNPEWLGGYKGFVQMIVIMLMSEKMKEKENAYSI